MITAISNVGLLLTMRCSFSCAHCITRSGPETDAHIPTEQALALVEEISRVSERINFTGGESLLRRETLFACIERAAALGLSVSLVTNAYWATSDAATDRLLRRLIDAGLSRLCISIDQFHQPFVSSDNALRAAGHCVRAGIEQVLRVCSFEGDSFYDTLADRAQQEGLQIERLSLVRAGRARSLPDSYFQKTRASGRCMAVHLPAVLPSGAVRACCGPAIHFDEANPLHLGNWQEEPLAQILTRARANLFLMAMQNWGPLRMASLVGASEDQYTSICDLCEKICADQDALRALEGMLEVQRQELIAGQVYQQACAHSVVDLSQEQQLWQSRLEKVRDYWLKEQVIVRAQVEVADKVAVRREHRWIRVMKWSEKLSGRLLTGRKANTAVQFEPQQISGVSVVRGEEALDPVETLRIIDPSTKPQT